MKIFNLIGIAMVFTLMMTASVLAFNIDATRWNTRGEVSLANINAYYSETLNWAKGSYNAHLNLQRGVSGSGHLYVQARNSQYLRDRLEIRWDSKGNNYGFEVTTDNEEETILLANARVTRTYQEKYTLRGRERVRYVRDEIFMPVTITYNKITDQLMVDGSGFNIG